MVDSDTSLRGACKNRATPPFVCATIFNASIVLEDIYSPSVTRRGLSRRWLILQVATFRIPSTRGTSSGVCLFQFPAPPFERLSSGHAHFSCYIRMRSTALALERAINHVQIMCFLCITTRELEKRERDDYESVVLLVYLPSETPSEIVCYRPDLQCCQHGSRSAAARVRYFTTDRISLKTE